MKKKLLLTLLAVILSILPTFVKAATEINGIYYNLNSTTKTAAVTSMPSGYYTGTVSIPKTVKTGGVTYNVTSIGDRAFLECSGLTSVTISNSVTSIGDYAFCNCSGLTSVTIPNSVTSIGDRAFEFSPFINNMADGVIYLGKCLYQYKGTMPENTKIVIVDGTISISPSAFSGCSGLTSVTIPNSVTSIGSSAFYKCSGLTSVTIPNSVTSIGKFAFKGCSGLTSITIPNSVTSIDFDAFSGCSGLTSVTIPNSVTSIGSSTFSGCSNLTSVTIPNSVTSIGSNAFEGCSSLTSVTIPNSVISIGSHAFEGCSGLTSVNIPNSVTSIGQSAFYNCGGLTSVTIGSKVASYGSSIFSGCKYLTSITVLRETPVKLTSYICNHQKTILYVPKGSEAKYVTANYWKEFKNIVVNENVVFDDPAVKDLCITNWDTDGNNMLSFVEAAAVTDLGSVFKEKTNITWFNELRYFTGLSSIGSTAFQGCCGLTSIFIPQNVTSIDADAFNNCSGLTSIFIPSSVTSIDYSAFYGCTGLNSIEVSTGNPTYYSHYDWGESNAIIERQTKKLIKGCNATTIPPDVTAIGPYAFEGCSGLTYVNYFGAITDIGEGAFSNCTGLKSIGYTGTGVSIELNGVITIGNNAFSGCSGLTSICIPSSVTSIGSSVFKGCNNLTSIEVDKLNRVYSSRNNCNAIIEMQTNTLIQGCKATTIPNSIIAIGPGAFSSHNGLTSINIPNSVTYIDNYAFQDCSGLTSVTIGNSVTSIGESAFEGCRGLTSVTIPNCVTSIGDYAFFGCSSLAKIKSENATPPSIQRSIISNYGKLFVPEGSRSSYASANYWKEFTIKEYPNSDVNEDNITDVVDVVDIARFVVAIPSTSFEEFLSDMNGDRYVNIADAIVLVNEIAGNTQFAKPALAPRKLASDMLALFGDGSNLSLEMEGNGDYAAFQFDLWLPADMDLMQVSLNDARRQGHQLLYNKVGDGHYRVVALSTSGNIFSGTSGELLSMTLDDFVTDDVRIDNIHFVTARGIDVPFEAIGVNCGNNGVTTDIRSVDSNNTTKPVYNLNGQRLTAPRKGLNIIGGKKIVVK